MYHQRALIVRLVQKYQTEEQVRWVWSTIYERVEQVEREGELLRQVRNPRNQRTFLLRYSKKQQNIHNFKS